jgi:hypothetical protein
MTRPTADARPILAGQLTALEALIVLARTHAHLPAVDMQVGSIFPDTIRMHIHHDLGAFEAWREALGIPGDSVDHSAFDGRVTLKASTAFHGATVDITGYATALPAVTS